MSTKGNEQTYTFKEMVTKVHEIIDYLFSVKFKILLFVVVGALLMAVYAYLEKPSYRAALNFSIEDSKGEGGLGGALSLVNMAGIDLGGAGGNGVFSGQNLMELIKSRKIIEQCLLNQVSINGRLTTLADVYLDTIGFRSKLEEENAKVNFGNTSNHDSLSLMQNAVLYQLYNNVRTKDVSVYQNDKKVSIISVSVNSTNEHFSKLLVEGLVSEVSKFYTESKSSKSRLNVEILSRQADSVRRELNMAIGNVAEINNNLYNLNTALNIQRVPVAKRQIDVQANTAILTQLVTNLELAKIALRKETPLIQIIDRPYFPLEKFKLGYLKAIILGVILGLFSSITYFILIKIWKTLLK